MEFLKNKFQELKDKRVLHTFIILLFLLPLAAASFILWIMGFFWGGITVAIIGVWWYWARRI